VDLKVLGARVRMYRKQAGLRGSDLADGAGVTQSYISAIENGHQMPSLRVLAQIADTLGVSPAVFIDEPTEENALTRLMRELPEAERKEVVQYAFWRLARLAADPMTSAGFSSPMIAQVACA